MTRSNKDKTLAQHKTKVRRETKESFEQQYGRPLTEREFTHMLNGVDSFTQWWVTDRTIDSQTNFILDKYIPTKGNN